MTGPESPGSGPALEEFIVDIDWNLNWGRMDAFWRVDTARTLVLGLWETYLMSGSSGDAL